MSYTTPRSVIVVGAGSAGSVIARRLAEAGTHVHVFEAGGEDVNPAIYDPARVIELWHGHEDWDYYTVPQPHAGGRRLHLPRGRVLGGSHALNGMIWVRGNPSDYDHWARMGCAGWGWEDVAPVFRSIENYSCGESKLRGNRGLLDMTDAYRLSPIQQSVIDAAVQEGIPWNPDYNGEHQDGIGIEQVTMRNGRRVTTYTAYLKPLRMAVQVHIGCRVHQILVDRAAGKLRAVGVRYTKDGQEHELTADEVVVCAGVMDSPRLLLRSGIGPADELRALGIESTVDLPGVGRNLHDHLLVPVIFTTKRPVGPPEAGVSVTQVHWFWRSRPELDAPDTQPIVFSVPYYVDGMAGPPDAFTLLGGLIRPTSRGKVTLAGPGPDDGLVIDPDFLATPEDVAALIASVAQCRRVGRQAALKAWGATELYPGPGVADDALEDYVRRTAVTYHHQVGTCAMGRDPHAATVPAVVSPHLVVHGIEGLRVADASVMPRITSGNTNAPSIMIGERAAQFILGKA